MDESTTNTSGSTGSLTNPGVANTNVSALDGKQALDISKIGDYDDDTSLGDIAKPYFDLGTSAIDIANQAADNVGAAQVALIGNDFGATNNYMRGQYYEPAANTIASTFRQAGAQKALEVGMERGQAAAEAELAAAQEAYTNAWNAFKNAQVAEFDEGQLGGATSYSEFAAANNIADASSREEAQNSAVDVVAGQFNLSHGEEVQSSDAWGTATSQTAKEQIGEAAYNAMTDAQKKEWAEANSSKIAENYDRAQIAENVGGEAVNVYNSQLEKAKENLGLFFDYFDQKIDTDYLKEHLQTLSTITYSNGTVSIAGSYVPSAGTTYLQNVTQYLQDKFAQAMDKGSAFTDDSDVQYFLSDEWIENESGITDETVKEKLKEEWKTLRERVEALESDATLGENGQVLNSITNGIGIGFAGTLLSKNIFVGLATALVSTAANLIGGKKQNQQAEKGEDISNILNDAVGILGQYTNTNEATVNGVKILSSESKIETSEEDQEEAQRQTMGIDLTSAQWYYDMKVNHPDDLESLKNQYYQTMGLSQTFEVADGSKYYYINHEWVVPDAGTVLLFAAPGTVDDDGNIVNEDFKNYVEAFRNYYSLDEDTSDEELEEKQSQISEYYNKYFSTLYMAKYWADKKGVALNDDIFHAATYYQDPTNDTYRNFKVGTQTYADIIDAWNSKTRTAFQNDLTSLVRAAYKGENGYFVTSLDGTVYTQPFTVESEDTTIDTLGEGSDTFSNYTRAEAMTLLQVLAGSMKAYDDGDTANNISTKKLNMTFGQMASQCIWSLFSPTFKFLDLLLTGVFAGSEVLVAGIDSLFKGTNYFNNLKLLANNVPIFTASDMASETLTSFKYIAADLTGDLSNEEMVAAYKNNFGVEASTATSVLLGAPKEGSIEFEMQEAALQYGNLMTIVDPMLASSFLDEDTLATSLGNLYRTDRSSQITANSTLLNALTNIPIVGSIVNVAASGYTGEGWNGERIAYSAANAVASTIGSQLRGNVSEALVSCIKDQVNASRSAAKETLGKVKTKIKESYKDKKLGEDKAAHYEVVAVENCTTPKLNANNDGTTNNRNTTPKLNANNDGSVGDNTAARVEVVADAANTKVQEDSAFCTAFEVSEEDTAGIDASTKRSILNAFKKAAKNSKGSTEETVKSNFFTKAYNWIKLKSGLTGVLENPKSYLNSMSTDEIKQLVSDIISAKKVKQSLGGKWTRSDTLQVLAANGWAGYNMTRMLDDLRKNTIKNHVMDALDSQLTWQMSNSGWQHTTFQEYILDLDKFNKSVGKAFLNVGLNYAKAKIAQPVLKSQFDKARAAYLATGDLECKTEKGKKAKEHMEAAYGKLQANMETMASRGVSQVYIDKESEKIKAETQELFGQLMDKMGLTDNGKKAKVFNSKEEYDTFVKEHQLSLADQMVLAHVGFSTEAFSNYLKNKSKMFGSSAFSLTNLSNPDIWLSIAEIEEETLAKYGKEILEDKNLTPVEKQQKIYDLYKQKIVEELGGTSIEGLEESLDYEYSTYLEELKTSYNEWSSMRASGEIASDAKFSNWMLGYTPISSIMQSPDSYADGAMYLGGSLGTSYTVDRKATNSTKSRASASIKRQLIDAAKNGDDEVTLEVYNDKTKEYERKTVSVAAAGFNPLNRLQVHQNGNLAVKYYSPIFGEDLGWTSDNDKHSFTRQAFMTGQAVFQGDDLLKNARAADFDYTNNQLQQMALRVQKGLKRLKNDTSSSYAEIAAIDSKIAQAKQGTKYEEITNSVMYLKQQRRLQELEAEKQGLLSLKHSNDFVMVSPEDVEHNTFGTYEVKSLDGKTSYRVAYKAGDIYQNKHYGNSHMEADTFRYNLQSLENTIHQKVANGELSADSVSKSGYTNVQFEARRLANDLSLVFDTESQKLVKTEGKTADGKYDVATISVSLPNSAIYNIIQAVSGNTINGESILDNYELRNALYHDQNYIMFKNVASTKTSKVQKVRTNAAGQAVIRLDDPIRTIEVDILDSTTKRPLTRSYVVDKNISKVDDIIEARQTFKARTETGLSYNTASMRKTLLSRGFTQDEVDTIQYGTQLEVAAMFSTVADKENKNYRSGVILESNYKKAKEIVNLANLSGKTEKNMSTKELKEYNLAKQVISAYGTDTTDEKVIENYKNSKTYLESLKDENGVINELAFAGDEKKYKTYLTAKETVKSFEAADKESEVTARLASARASYGKKYLFGQKATSEKNVSLAQYTFDQKEETGFMFGKYKETQADLAKNTYVVGSGEANKTRNSVRKAVLDRVLSDVQVTSGKDSVSPAIKQYITDLMDEAEGEAQNEGNPDNEDSLITFNTVSLHNAVMDKMPTLTVLAALDSRDILSNITRLDNIGIHADSLPVFLKEAQEHVKNSMLLNKADLTTVAETMLKFQNAIEFATEIGDSLKNTLAPIKNASYDKLAGREDEEGEDGGYDSDQYAMMGMRLDDEGYNYEEEGVQSNKPIRDISEIDTYLDSLEDVLKLVVFDPDGIAPYSGIYEGLKAYKLDFSTKTKGVYDQFTDNAYSLYKGIEGRIKAGNKAAKLAAKERAGDTEDGEETSKKTNVTGGYVSSNENSVSTAEREFYNAVQTWVEGNRSRTVAHDSRASRRPATEAEIKKAIANTLGVTAFEDYYNTGYNKHGLSNAQLIKTYEKATKYDVEAKQLTNEKTKEKYDNINYGKTFYSYEPGYAESLKVNGGSYYQNLGQIQNAIVTIAQLSKDKSSFTELAKQVGLIQKEVPLNMADSTDPYSLTTQNLIVAGIMTKNQAEYGPASKFSQLKVKDFASVVNLADKYNASVNAEKEFEEQDDKGKFLQKNKDAKTLALTFGIDIRTANEKEYDKIGEAYKQQLKDNTVQIAEQGKTLYSNLGLGGDFEKDVNTISGLKYDDKKLYDIVVAGQPFRAEQGNTSYALINACTDFVDSTRDDTNVMMVTLLDEQAEKIESVLNKRGKRTNGDSANIVYKATLDENTRAGGTYIGGLTVQEAADKLYNSSQNTQSKEDCLKHVIKIWGIQNRDAVKESFKDNYPDADYSDEAFDADFDKAIKDGTLNDFMIKYAYSKKKNGDEEYWDLTDVKGGDKSPILEPSKIELNGETFNSDWRFSGKFKAGTVIKTVRKSFDVSGMTVSKAVSSIYKTMVNDAKQEKQLSSDSKELEDKTVLALPSAEDTSDVSSIKKLSQEIVKPVLEAYKKQHKDAWNGINDLVNTRVYWGAQEDSAPLKAIAYNLNEQANNANKKAVDYEKIERITHISSDRLSDRTASAHSNWRTNATIDEVKNIANGTIKTAVRSGNANHLESMTTNKDMFNSLANNTNDDKQLVILGDKFVSGISNDVKAGAIVTVSDENGRTVKAIATGDKVTIMRTGKDTWKFSYSDNDQTVYTTNTDDEDKTYDAKTPSSKKIKNAKLIVTSNEASASSDIATTSYLASRLGISTDQLNNVLRGMKYATKGNKVKSGSNILELVGLEKYGLARMANNEISNGNITSKYILNNDTSFFILGSGTDAENIKKASTSNKASNFSGFMTGKILSDGTNTLYTDKDFAQFRTSVDETVKEIETARKSGRTIVMNKDGITGLKELKDSAPRCYDYLAFKLGQQGFTITIGEDGKQTVKNTSATPYASSVRVKANINVVTPTGFSNQIVDIANDFGAETTTFGLANDKKTDKANIKRNKANSFSSEEVNIADRILKNANYEDSVLAEAEADLESTTAKKTRGRVSKAVKDSGEAVDEATTNAVTKKAKNAAEAENKKKNEAVYNAKLVNARIYAAVKNADIVIAVGNTYNKDGSSSVSAKKAEIYAKSAGKKFYLYDQTLKRYWTNNYGEAGLGSLALCKEAPHLTENTAIISDTMTAEGVNAVRDLFDSASRTGLGNLTEQPEFWNGEYTYLPTEMLERQLKQNRLYRKSLSYYNTVSQYRDKTLLTDRQNELIDTSTSKSHALSMDKPYINNTSANNWPITTKSYRYNSETGKSEVTGTKNYKFSLRTSVDGEYSFDKNGSPVVEPEYEFQLVELKENKKTNKIAEIKVDFDSLDDMEKRRVSDAVTREFYNNGSYSAEGANTAARMTPDGAISYKETPYKAQDLDEMKYSDFNKSKTYVVPVEEFGDTLLDFLAEEEATATDVWKYSDTAQAVEQAYNKYSNELTRHGYEAPDYSASFFASDPSTIELEIGNASSLSNALSYELGFRLTGDHNSLVQIEYSNNKFNLLLKRKNADTNEYETTTIDSYDNAYDMAAVLSDIGSTDNKIGEGFYNHEFSVSIPGQYKTITLTNGRLISATGNGSFGDEFLRQDILNWIKDKQETDGDFNKKYLGNIICYDQAYERKAKESKRVWDNGLVVTVTRNKDTGEEELTTVKGSELTTPGKDTLYTKTKSFARENASPEEEISAHYEDVVDDVNSSHYFVPVKMNSETGEFKYDFSQIDSYDWVVSSKLLRDYYQDRMKKTLLNCSYANALHSIKNTFASDDRFNNATEVAYESSDGRLRLSRIRYSADGKYISYTVDELDPLYQPKNNKFVPDYETEQAYNDRTIKFAMRPIYGSSIDRFQDGKDESETVFNFDREGNAIAEDNTAIRGGQYRFRKWIDGKPQWVDIDGNPIELDFTDLKNQDYQRSRVEGQISDIANEEAKIRLQYGITLNKDKKHQNQFIKNQVAANKKTVKEGKKELREAVANAGMNVYPEAVTGDTLTADLVKEFYGEKSKQYKEFKDLKARRDELIETQNQYHDFYQDRNGYIYYGSNNTPHGYVSTDNQKESAQTFLDTITKNSGVKVADSENITEAEEQEIVNSSANKSARKDMQNEINSNLNAGRINYGNTESYLDISATGMDYATAKNAITAYDNFNADSAALLKTTQGEQTQAGSRTNRGEMGTGGHVLVSRDYANTLEKIASNNGGIADSKAVSFFNESSSKLSEIAKTIQDQQMAGGVANVNAATIAKIRSAIYNDPAAAKQYMDVFLLGRNHSEAAAYVTTRMNFISEMVMATGDTSVLDGLQRAVSATTGLDDAGGLESASHNIYKQLNGEYRYKAKSKLGMFTEGVLSDVDALLSSPTFDDTFPILKVRMLEVEYDNALRTMQRNGLIDNLVFDTSDMQRSVTNASFDLTDKAAESEIPEWAETGKYGAGATKNEEGKYLYSKDEIKAMAMKMAYASVTSFFEPNKTFRATMDSFYSNHYTDLERRVMADYTGATRTKSLLDHATDACFALRWRQAFSGNIRNGAVSMFSGLIKRADGRASGNIDAFSASADKFVNARNAQGVGTVVLLAILAYLWNSALGYHNITNSDLSLTDEKGNWQIPPILTKIQTLGRFYLPNDTDEDGNQYINPNKSALSLDSFSSMFSMPNSVNRTLDKAINPSNYATNSQRGLMFAGSSNSGVNSLLNNQVMAAVGDELIAQNLLSPYRAIYEVMFNTTYYGNNIWERKYLSDGSENPNYNPLRNVAASMAHITGLFDLFMSDGTNKWVKGYGSSSYVNTGKTGTVAGSGILQNEYASALISLFQDEPLSGIVEAFELPIKVTNISGQARSDFNTSVKNQMAQYVKEYLDATENTTVKPDTTDAEYRKLVKNCANLVASWSADNEYVLGQNQELVAYVAKIMMAVCAGEYDSSLNYVQNAYWKASQTAQIESGDSLFLDDDDLEEWINSGKTSDEYAAERNRRSKAYTDAVNDEYIARQALISAGVPEEYFTEYSYDDVTSAQTTVNRMAYNAVFSKLNSQVGEFNNYAELKAYYETQIDAADSTSDKAYLAKKYNSIVKEALAPYVEKYGYGILVTSYAKGYSTINTAADYIIIPADTTYTGSNPRANYIKDMFGVGYKDSSNLTSDKDVLEVYTKATLAAHNGALAQSKSLLDRLIKQRKKGSVYISDYDMSRILRLRSTLEAKAGTKTAAIA